MGKHNKEYFRTGAAFFNAIGLRPVGNAFNLASKLFDYLPSSKRNEVKRIQDRLGKIKSERVGGELTRGIARTKRKLDERQRVREQENLNRRLEGIQREAEENAHVRQVNKRLKNVRKEREALERQRGNPALRFMEGDWVTDFKSSCVKAFRYDVGPGILFIKFKERDGSESHYRYGIPGNNNITGEMAMSLFRAASKGTWVWDNLRIRGTKVGHRVPYYMISSGNAPRKYESTFGTHEAHLERVAGESKKSGSNEPSSAYEKLFQFNRPRVRPVQR